MPENTNQFTDIISAEVDVQSFQNSLNQLKTVYENFIAGLDETTRKGLGLGFSQTFSVAVKELSGSLAEFRKDLVGSIGQLEGSVAAILNKVDQSVDATAKNIKTKLGAAADSVVGPGRAESLRRDIDIEQEGVVNSKLEADAKTLRKNLSEINQVFRDRETQREKEAAAESQRIEKALAVERQQALRERQRQEEQAYSQLNQLQQRQVADEKVVSNERQQARLAERRKQQEIDQAFADRDIARKREEQAEISKVEKSLDKQRIDSQKERARQEEALYKQRAQQQKQQSAEQITAAKEEAKARQEAATKEKQAQEAQLKDLQKFSKLKQEIRQAEDAVGKSQKERSFAEVSGPSVDNLRKRIELLKTEISAAQKRLQELFSQESKLKGSDPFSAERLNNLKEIVKETDNLNKHQRQLNSVTESNKKATEGFFSHMLHGFKNTTSLVIRFYTVFALLQAAIDLIKFTIGAPFEILADGLKYMQGIEESASDLVGVLAANAVFSKDMATNFQLAKAASIELVQLLKNRAIATGTTFDALNSTFKALLQGGGLQVVGTLEELVKLAELFQQSLSAAGVGGLAAQGSIQEISKLFNGVPNDYNKFLALLKITPAEWQKIVKESKTHRDLLDRLPSSVKNYADALELARFNQLRLTKQFGELIDLIGGEGAKPLFSFITDALQKAVKFLEENFNKVVAFVYNIAEAAAFLGNEFVSSFSGAEGSLESIFRKMVLFNSELLKTISLITFFAGSFKDAADNIFGNTRDLPKGFDKLSPEELGKALAKQTPQMESYFDKVAKRQVDYANDLKKINDLTQKSIELFERGGREESKLLKFRVGVNPPPGIEPKTNTKESRDQLRSILEEFRLAREQFNEDAEEIREKAKTVRDSIRQEVTDRVLSEREAAAFLITSIEEEKKQLDDLRNKIAETAGSIASKIAKQIADPEIRKRGLITLDKEFTAFRKQQVKSDFQLNNEIITQQRKAGKEKVAIDQEVVEDRRRVQEQAIKSSLELLSIAREAGILTETQYFDQVRELEEEQLEIEKSRLQERLALETAATDDRLKLLNQLKLVEQKIADFRSVSTEKVQRNTERDLQLVRDYAQALAQADFARQQNQLQFINELRPEAGFNSIIIEGINLRAKELDLLEKNLQIQLDIAAAKNSETEETRRLTVQLANLRNERDQLFEVEVREILRGTRRSRPSISGNQDDFSFFGNFVRGAQGAAQAAEPGSVQGAIDRVSESELRRRNFAFTQAIAERFAFADANKNNLNDPKVSNRLKILDLEVQRTAASARDFRVKVLEGQLKAGFTNFKRGVLDGLFGPGTVQNFKNATTSQDKLAVAADGAVNALANIGAIISNIQQGTQNGGTLGGIGAGISGISSVLGSGLLQKIPFVGQFLPAIGGILSFVGGLFAQSAKKIAADVKKSFQSTIENYQSGNASLVSTIQLLEQQRLSAITRLSGSKTGKKELESILPEFDNQLQQLRKTQQEVISSFDDALFILRQNSDVLSNVNKQWQDINNQVKDYIGAGGDAAKAAEFLSLSLLKIRKDAASELSSAEQEAIQEAIKLNDLLKERQKIVDDFSKKEFDIINKNAIERRKSNTVQAAEELNLARKQRDEDLANIDNEIRLGNQKLERQKEIFSLAADTASLRRRDEELSLAALDAQIARLKDLRSIVQSISIGPNGLATSSLLPAAPTQININITGLSDNQAGAAIADSLSNELERRFRIVPVS